MLHNDMAMIANHRPQIVPKLSNFRDVLGLFKDAEGLVRFFRKVVGEEDG